MNYRRAFVPNGYLHIIITSYDRKPIFIENIDILRTAFKNTKTIYEFEIIAICVLPNHIHLILHPNNITMGQAIKYARKGSTIVLVAVFAGIAEVDLAVANDHELDIKSTMMYRHDDYIDGIRLVNEGKVHLKPLISKTFAFKDYLKAYQYIDDNRETTMKVIINVSEK